MTNQKPFSNMDFLAKCTGQKQNLPPHVEIHFEFLKGILREDKDQVPRLLLIVKTVREFMESGIGGWSNPQYNSDIIIDPRTNKQYDYKDIKDWGHIKIADLEKEGLPT